MPSASVTLIEAVGDINSGNSPIKLEIKTSTANVATTGKYLKPCSPITLTTKSRSAKIPASSVNCPFDGSSVDNFPLRIQMTIIVRIQAMTNITVYHGIAVSGVYSPNKASGLVPSGNKIASQIGRVYFI